MQLQGSTTSGGTDVDDGRSEGGSNCGTSTTTRQTDDEGVQCVSSPAWVQVCQQSDMVPEGAVYYLPPVDERGNYRHHHHPRSPISFSIWVALLTLLATLTLTFLDELALHHQ